MSILERIGAELLALDKTVNSIGGGDIEQTLSARAYAVTLSGGDPFWNGVIDRLFSEGHCQRAWEAEMQAIVTQSQLAAARDILDAQPVPTDGRMVVPRG